MKIKIVLILAVLMLTFISINAQQKADFNYKAQKNYIPKELGKVYLGMPFNEFAKQINLSKAKINSRFEFLTVEIPFEKGNIKKLSVRVHDLSEEEKKVVLFEETVKMKDELGYEYEDKIERIDANKLSEKSLVYAIYIDFKDDFDLKTYVIKTFGKDGEVRKPDDQYHFFDIQWTTKTSDGLTWLIRSFHEGENKSLQLLGRIDGTEWGLES